MGERIQASVRDDDGALLWSDSVVLVGTRSVASGIIRIPVSPLGIGVVNVVVDHPRSRDSTRASLFVSFGVDLPVASFDDMLGYLIYYASPRRLALLRNASPAERASVWAAFLRETDPAPETAQHEALQAYFGRIQQANRDFREEAVAGWRTDRGRVSVALGPPDQVIEPTGGAMNQRNVTRVWEYPRFQLQLVFVDQTGFNQWRLTPDSEMDFQAVVRREQVR
jgi:GWxTD domain-containing protein